MKKVNYFLVFFLVLTILMPLSISESIDVENSEVSPENSGYKSIQIRFLALDDVDKYNVYFSQENFNRTTDATLHSRILVQDDISSLGKFSSQNTLSACWFSTDGSFGENSIQFSYKDDWGVPIIPSNSTNIVYNLVGLQTNVTYWFTVVAVNGDNCKPIGNISLQPDEIVNYICGIGRNDWNAPIIFIRKLNRVLTKTTICREPTS